MDPDFTTPGAQWPDVAHNLAVAAQKLAIRHLPSAETVVGQVFSKSV
jgi:hypothetical protein